MNTKAVAMIVTYRPKPGQEDAVRALVVRHGTTLRAVGLLDASPVQVWQATDEFGPHKGQPYFIEKFSWCDKDAPEVAHQTPEVVALWEPMEALTSELRFAQLHEISLPV